MKFVYGGQPKRDVGSLAAGIEFAWLYFQERQGTVQVYLLTVSLSNPYTAVSRNEM